ncbi:hypothetical protein FOA52_009018 [Chlamydomonas sp. UWO 241]|nr:hypothetical protein FOA52_009018 [Chlamydomonas sp. UWO 241]
MELNRFGTQASRDKKSPGGKWVIMPDETWWIYWTYLTVASALITAFIEPFKIAFTNSAGEFPGTSIWSIQDYIGTAIFWIDLTLRFFVANHDNETGTLATDLKSIRRNYVRPPGMFWWVMCSGANCNSIRRNYIHPPGMYWLGWVWG